MTTMEKNVVLEALGEYVSARADAERKFREAGDLSAALAEMRKRGIASGVLSYWPDVVAAKCGGAAI